MDKIDILNREEFVGQLVNLVKNISMNKSSTCFALNGDWGCGKSFVLDMFQQELEQIQSEKTGDSRFFVIRYNCWKYDYYEEPLVAIISAMISMIEEKISIFKNPEEKRKILGMLKAVGISLFSMGNYALKEKMGLDMKNFFEILRTGAKEGAEAYEKEHSYDEYFDFQKAIKDLTGLLQEITEKYTVIFLVDELDRCMPEYAIKVLERLHHLTEENSNIITVIAIDKKQLISSVKQIFGFENPAKYLEKFIHFEIELDYGEVSEKITEKYKDYVALFDRDIFPFDERVEECLQAIFTGIDVRTQERLVKKAMIVHKLLYTEKKDYSFMCMELLLVVMICVYGDDSCFSGATINGDFYNAMFTIRGQNQQPVFIDFFDNKFEAIEFKRKIIYPSETTSYTLPQKENLYGAIIYTWYWMHKPNKSFVFACEEHSVYEPIVKNHEELKKYVETIKMIS